MSNPPACVLPSSAHGHAHRGAGRLRATCLAAVALLPGVAGCGPGAEIASSERVPSIAAAHDDAAEASAPAGGFPRRVLGQDGVELGLAAAPRRVVPASAALVDLACALLPPERIAGLPGQALAYSALRDPDSPYLQRPRFEVYAAEPVLALSPDLVLADAWQARETTERLRAAGVPVLVLGGIERLDETEGALRLLAGALGVDDACEALLADLHARVDALRAGGAHRRGWRAVSYVNGGTGGWVAGAGTTPDEWIALTGMTNAAADRTGHVRCSFEQLLAMDADLIVVSGRAAYDDMGGTQGLLRREPVLADLAAVRTGRIVVLDAWLYNTLGLHAVRAAEVLAAAADALMGAPPVPGAAR